MKQSYYLTEIVRYDPVVRFVNRLDWQPVAEILLSNRGTYMENTRYIVRMASAVEEYLESLIDRSIEVNISYRVVAGVTMFEVTPFYKTVLQLKNKRVIARIQEYTSYDTVNNLSLENKVLAACEDYIVEVRKRSEKKASMQYKKGTNPTRSNISELCAPK